VIKVDHGDILRKKPKDASLPRDLPMIPIALCALTPSLV
jgi:hypothetical protein